MAGQAKMSDSELLALAIAEIQIGVAMARAAGVVCGSPRDIRLTKSKDTI